jgi:hypothetical protein
MREDEKDALCGLHLQLELFLELYLLATGGFSDIPYIFVTVTMHHGLRIPVHLQLSELACDY